MKHPETWKMLHWLSDIYYGGHKSYWLLYIISRTNVAYMKSLEAK